MGGDGLSARGDGLSESGDRLSESEDGLRAGGENENVYGVEL